MPSQGFIRLGCRRTHHSLAMDFCYPFHTACWALLREISGEKPDSIETLFNIFESLHYDRASRSLSWGHNYYFEDLADERSRQAYQGDNIAPELADPSQFVMEDE